MKISFSKIAVPARGVIVVTVAEAATGKNAKKNAGSGPVLGQAAAAIDARTKGALRRAITAAEFSGKREKTLQLLSPGDGSFTRVVVIGVGDPSSLMPPRRNAWAPRFMTRSPVSLPRL